MQILIFTLFDNVDIPNTFKLLPIFTLLHNVDIPNTFKLLDIFILFDNDISPFTYNWLNKFAIPYISTWFDNQWAVYENDGGERVFIGTIEEVNAWLSLKDKGYEI